MISMIFDWLSCLSNNSFVYKQFSSKFILAAFNKYTLTSIILQLRNDLHTYITSHPQKKDKPNKINVNLARTWFHFSPFVWNIKSQNDNFPPFLWFWVKTYQFQKAFAWNCYNYVKQAWIHWPITNANYELCLIS